MMYQHSKMSQGRWHNIGRIHACSHIHVEEPVHRNFCMGNVMLFDYYSIGEGSQEGLAVYSD